MGDISPSFNRSEFACKCGCGFDTVDIKTLTTLQVIRNTFGSITVHSGCRCPEYNKKVGGEDHSQHMLGRATDFTVEGKTPNEIQEWLIEHYSELSIGRYDTFTHIDTRTNGPARWDFRTHGK